MMKFREILEHTLNERGLRMGQKDLSTTNIDNMTIGFEFEIVVNKDKVYDNPKEKEEFIKSWSGYTKDMYINEKILARYGSTDRSLINLSPIYGYVPMYYIELKRYEDSKEKTAKCQQLLDLPEETTEEKKKKIIRIYYALQASVEERDNEKKVSTINSLSDKPDFDGTVELDHYLQRYKNLAKQAIVEMPDKSNKEYSNEYFYDNDDNIITFKDIKDFNTFESLFDYNETEFNKLYQQHYARKSIMAWNTYVQKKYFNQNNLTVYGDDDLEYDTDKVVYEDEIVYGFSVFSKIIPGLEASDWYHGAKNSSNWRIEPDSSISCGFELISPPLPLKKGLEILPIVLKTISDNYALSTDETTGLHINIGTWPHGEGLDLLKLSLLMGDTHVLKLFNREKPAYGRVNYAQPILNDMVMYLNMEDKNISYKELIHNVNDVILNTVDKGSSTSVKYKTINFNHLKKYGYIEFRASGGVNYNLKSNDIINTIMRYARALSIASDPNAHRKEYLSKLYTTINSEKPFNQKIIGEYDGILRESEIKTLYDFIGKNKIDLQVYDDISSEMLRIRLNLGNFMNFMARLCKVHLPSSIIYIIRKIYEKLYKQRIVGTPYLPNIIDTAKNSKNNGILKIFEDLNEI